MSNCRCAVVVRDIALWISTLRPPCRVQARAGLGHGLHAPELFEPRSFGSRIVLRCISVGPSRRPTWGGQLAQPKNSKKRCKVP